MECENCAYYDDETIQGRAYCACYFSDKFEDEIESDDFCDCFENNGE